MNKRHQLALHWKRKAEARTNAQRVLPEMARQYFEEGRKVVAGRGEPAALHPFRLATKRFRYTLESFTELYGSGMHLKLALLKPVQDALGQVNDCVATKSSFRADPAFHDYLDKRAARKAREFYRSWLKEFDADGQEKTWVEFLSGLSETQAPIDRQSLAGDEVRGT